MRALPLLAPTAAIPAPPEDAAARALEAGYAAFDEIAASRRAEALARGRKVPCAEGCSACCAYPVEVIPIEVWRIMSEVRGWSKAAQKDLRARIHLGIEIARRARIKLHRVHQVGDKKSERYQEAYIAARIECPFLREGRCSIYALRPFNCRMHLVVDTEPRACSAPEGRTTTVEMADAEAAALVRAAERYAAESASPLPLASVTWHASFLLALREAWMLLEDDRLDFEAWIAQVTSNVDAGEPGSTPPNGRCWREIPNSIDHEGWENLAG